MHKMLIPTSNVVDWTDLQERVRQIFAEMGYNAESPKTIELAGRGKKEIDVYVVDPCASYNRIYLVECKYWSSPVPQEVVHSFKTVMEGAGASTGFIISKAGFQSGAFDAARFTNINLLTFDEFQQAYGDEWFQKQRSKLDKQMARLRQISLLHFDQSGLVCFHNNMFFRRPDQVERLMYFHKWIANLLADSISIWPESFRGPEPVKVANNPSDPCQEVSGWYEYATVRDYFVGLTAAATQCADSFDEFLSEARRCFDELPEIERGKAQSDVTRAMIEELPLRVLKDRIGENEFEAMLAKVRSAQPISTIGQ